MEYICYARFAQSTDCAALAMDPLSEQQSVDRAAQSEDAHAVVAPTDCTVQSARSIAGTARLVDCTAPAIDSAAPLAYPYLICLWAYQ